jgi:hypothetical protein
MSNKNVEKEIKEIVDREKNLGYSKYRPFNVYFPS